MSWRTRHYPNLKITKFSPKKLRNILSFHPNIYKSSPVLRGLRASFLIGRIKHEKDTTIDREYGIIVNVLKDKILS